jgi:hypothetical protein
MDAKVEDVKAEDVKAEGASAGSEAVPRARWFVSCF